MPFDSILPEDIPAYRGHLILTTRQESPVRCGTPMLYDDILECHPTVIRGIMVQKLDLDLEEENLVFGVDPGQRIGLSVFYRGREIGSSFYSSVAGAVRDMTHILGGLPARRRIVRIGNGCMQVAERIASMLDPDGRPALELEFVDEQGTSKKIKHYNQRGRRDMLSARYILHRE